MKIIIAITLTPLIHLSCGKEIWRVRMSKITPDTYVTASGQMFAYESPFFVGGKTACINRAWIKATAHGVPYARDSFVDRLKRDRYTQWKLTEPRDD